MPLLSFPVAFQGCRHPSVRRAEIKFSGGTVKSNDGELGEGKEVQIKTVPFKYRNTSSFLPQGGSIVFM